MDLSLTVLKQCPFCGGKANIFSSHYYDDILEEMIHNERIYEWALERFDHGFVVRCESCGVRTERVPNISLAIDLWNRRYNAKEDKPTA